MKLNNEVIAMKRKIGLMNNISEGNSEQSYKRTKTLVECILAEWPSSPEEESSQHTPQCVCDKRLVIRTYVAKRKSAPKTLIENQDVTKGKKIDKTESAFSNVTDDVLHGNLPTVSSYNEAIARSADLGEANNIFDNIQNDYGLGEPNNPCLLSSASSLMQNIPNMTTPTYPSFTSFGKSHLTLSSTSSSNKFNLFHTVEVTDTGERKMNNRMNNPKIVSPTASLKENIVNSRPNPPYAGFLTARGNQIPVSSALISKKTNIFRNIEVSVDEVRDMNGWINDQECDIKIGQFGESSATVPKVTTSNVMQVPFFAGFSTAGGKQISVSAAMVSKKTNIFQNDDDLRDRDSWIELNNEEKCEKSSVIVSKESTSNVMQVPIFAGFSTAGGKQISVSAAMISKKTNIFQNVEVTVDDLRKMDNWTDNNELDTDNRVNRLNKSSETVSEKNVTISKSNVRGGLTSTLAKMKSPNILFDKKSNQSNSSEFSREVTNSLHPSQRETNMVPHRNLLIGKSDKSPINTFVKSSPLRKFPMVNSLRKLEVESSKKNVDIQPTSLMQTPNLVKGYVCAIPTNNPKTLTQECRESAQLCLLDDELCSGERGNSSAGFMAQINARTIISSTPIRKIDSFVSRPKQTRLVERFDDLVGEDYFEPNMQNERKIQITFDIISLRREAFEVQRRSINEKTNVKPVPGTLFVNKLTAHKVKWKEFVDNSRPTTIKNVLPTSAPKLANNVLHVTTENATKFKFNAWVHYSDEFCRENVDGIHLEDDIVAMMDENCQIGLKEISNAFLSCPSVDPKLIHDKWIENSMKWIVIKLAGMERSFPHRFAGIVLTIHNLFLQMKFRYDREIDHVERSAIRKICEMDDTATKRMVLFVAKVTTNGYQYQLELCDGWYSLLSTLDYEMRKLVDKGKIKVGTKLVIHGAEVEHLQNGCHPLDIPSNVRLKIYVNSTRRVGWDAKLGYCKNPGPFKISLSSVQPAGGKITNLNVCVLRVYPVTYVFKSSSGLQIYSEKVERRRCVKEERERTIIIDKIFNQVCKDFEDEQKAARYDKYPKKMLQSSDISTVTDVVELCHLLENDNDPDRIVNEMTHFQRRMVENYKEKLSCLRSEQINNRVKEKLSFIDKNTASSLGLFK